jgi:hypothetical protein
MSYPQPNYHPGLRRLVPSLTILAAAGLSRTGRGELSTAGGCRGMLAG